MSFFRTIPNSGDFSPLFRLLDDYDVHRTSKAQKTSVRTFTPRFDVRESSDAYHLDGELPGIAQKDIDIEFSDPQTLAIRGHAEREYHSTPDTSDDQDKSEGSEGEKQVEKSANKHRYWVNERSIGEFHRSFSFPTRVDQDNVKASLKDGILTLVIPKAAAPSARKITIE